MDVMWVHRRPAPQAVGDNAVMTAEEQRRVHGAQAVADGAGLEIVRSREGRGHVAGARRAEHERSDDVHHHASHVRQRQVGHSPVLMRRDLLLSRCQHLCSALQVPVAEPA